MTTRESARARTNFCHLGDVGKKESGRSSIFLGSVVRSVSDFLTLLARRARASQPLLLPLRHPVSPHFTPRARRRRRRRGRRPWTSPARLRRSLPLRRRRFLWRRRSSSRARLARLGRRGGRARGGGAPLDVRAVGAGDVDGLRARVVALLHLELDRFLLRGEKRRSGWMGNGDLVSSGKRSLAGKRSSAHAPGDGGALATKSARGDVSSIDGGGAGGGRRVGCAVGSDGPTARARAGARAARARGDGGARARGARRGGAKRVVMTGHWLGATGQPARGWEEKSRVARATHLAEAAKAVRVDGGLMDEDLVGAVVGGDEPEALLRVEPLHLREPGRSRGASIQSANVVVGFFPFPADRASRARGSGSDGVRVRRRRRATRTLPVSFVIVSRGRGGIEA